MQPTFRQVPPKVPPSMSATCLSSKSGVTRELPEPVPMIARSKCAMRSNLERPPSAGRPHARTWCLRAATVELDTQITRDGRAVVTHDPVVDGRKCRDTAPATPGDPAYPYVGKHVNTLRLAQVRTLDCGSRTLASFPRQKASPGARM